VERSAPSKNKKKTHPMTSAAAVLIQRPSPNGFGGTGDNSKCTSDEGALYAAVVRASVMGLDDLAMALVTR
jgi:hypothetical protein